MSPKDSSYICIECGKAVSELYRHLPGGGIKVTNCDDCIYPADKYIEFDPIIVVVDIILHKAQAYRHILRNTSHEWINRFALVLVFCDAYLKWEELHFKEKPQSRSDHLVNAAVEVQFYAMLGWALIDWLTSLLVTYAMLQCFERFYGYSNYRVEPITLFHCITLASFGKVLTVPASVWGLSQNLVWMNLTQLLVLSSRHVAIRALYQVKFWRSITALASASLGQKAIELLFAM